MSSPIESSLLPINSTDRVSFHTGKTSLSELELESNSVQTTRDLKLAEIQGENFTLGEEQFIKTIEKAIKAMQGPFTTFEVSIHEKTKQIMVKVIDKETGDIIREIPPEKNLDFVAKLMEMAGIIIDERK